MDAERGQWRNRRQEPRRGGNAEDEAAAGRWALDPDRRPLLILPGAAGGFQA